MLFFKSTPITQIESFAVSNLGKERQNNEDNFAINGKYMDEFTVEQSADGCNVCVSGGAAGPDKLQVFAVCDGMGGESLGEVASLTAAEQFARIAGKKESGFDSLVDQTVDKVNSMVLQKAEQTGHFRIGTTLALAYIIKGVLRVVNVGDSRVYLLHGGKLRQLSYDHTELQYYISAKIVSKDEARSHPMRHGLTQHLGMDGKELRPYRAKDVKLAAGDRILLCSDGVTEMLEDKDISALLSGAQNAQSAAEAIVAAALDKGGVDNTTCITVFVD